MTSWSNLSAALDPELVQKVEGIVGQQLLFKNQLSSSQLLMPRGS